MVKPAYGNRIASESNQALFVWATAFRDIPGFNPLFGWVSLHAQDEPPLAVFTTSLNSHRFDTPERRFGNCMKFWICDGRRLLPRGLF